MVFGGHFDTDDDSEVLKDCQCCSDKISVADTDTLKLEEIHGHPASCLLFQRNPQLVEEVRRRNLRRIEEAKHMKRITHLHLSYSSCTDKIQRTAIEELLAADERRWSSCTISGVGQIASFYNRLSPLTNLESLFLALGSIETLNLYSSPWYRGHDLDKILRLLPLFSHLRELRLEGWQLDRISVSALLEGLRHQASNTISLLSLQSCTLMEGDLFEEVISTIPTLGNLRTLNFGYCGLTDANIVTLVQVLRKHEPLRSLHIGGNKCVASASIEAISDWIRDRQCQISDLELRALWVDFSEEGLFDRNVALSPLCEALRVNRSLHSLSISENCVDDRDLDQIVSVLGTKYLRHLDVGNNPFSERGAEALLELVNNCPSLESIRFGNRFVGYKCAKAIHTRARINSFRTKLQSRPPIVSLGLWSRIFSKFHSHSICKSEVLGFQPDLVFHFLRTTSGESGLELAYRIATERAQQ